MILYINNICYNYLLTNWLFIYFYKIVYIEIII